MIEWFLKLIGAADTFTSDVSNVQWHWARPAFLWFGLVLLVPVAIFVVWRHGRNMPNVTRPTRAVLNACRIGVLLLLVVVLGGPYVRLDQTVNKKPILAVVVDASASMHLPAGPFDAAQAAALAAAAGLTEAGANGTDGEEQAATSEESGALLRRLNAMSRIELTEALLKHQNPTLLEPMKERFDLRWYRVARSVQKVPGPGDTEAASLSSSESDGTALGDMLNTVVDEAAADAVAGVLLLSDGRNTSGPDPLQVTKQRAGSGAGRGDATLAPVWAVPIGSATPLKDITLLDVFTPAQVSVGDVATVVVTIGSHGFANRDVKVTLKRGSEGLQDKTLTLRDDQRQQVELSYQTSAAGTDLLTIQVEPQPEEKVRPNNEQTLQLRVDARRLKLLYLEGAPRWDFRFLDHALRRDNGLDATIVMESQLRNQTEPPATSTLPQDADGFAEFDTIMIGDVSPELLPARAQSQLVKAVQDKGTGLIVQAGVAHMPDAFAGGPLVAILPTDFDAPEAQTTGAGGMEAPAHQPFVMSVTAQGAIHPAMRLYDSATRNRHIWGRMPRFYWAARTARPRAGASVLVELKTARGDKPLIVEHHAGRGRVLFVGTDSTFLWRQNIGSHLFDRFWGQAIRHVGHEPDRGGDQSWIDVRPARAEPGERIAVDLFTVGPDGAPLSQDGVEIVLTWTDSQETLALRRGHEDGHFHGTWDPADTGQYQISYTDAKGRAVNAAVHVSGSGQELREPNVDRKALATLAHESGGGLIEAPQLGTLAEKLAGEPTEQRLRHEKELWDNWLTLTLLVGLYCVDVGVRRMLGLP